LLGKIYNNQSIVLSDKNETELSIEKLQESARLYGLVYGEVSAAPAYYNLGLRYLDTEKYEDARLYFRKVLDIGENNEFIKAEYFGYLGFGIYYEKLGKINDAEYHLNKALEIAKLNQNPADQGRVYEQFYILYQNAGKYKESLTYFKYSNELRDSLKMVENKMIIDGLEAKYRLSESERENKTLKLKQTRQRLTFFIAGGVILLLIFLIIVFYIGIRAKNKKNQLLSIQKDEIDEKNKELQRLNEEIHAQKSQLEELNHTKDSMFSIISHDLRSPLGSVFMLMHMLDSEDGYSEQSASMVSELTNEVHHALFLLNNLMTWAHINIHDLKAEPEIVPLKALLNDILAYHRTDIDRKDLSLEMLIDSEIELLEDSGMVEVILKNIISNAIKFSDPNHPIIVKSIRENQHIIIEVQNKGAQIPESKISEIFKPGVRLQKGTMGERGSGLGLAICKSYLQVMDAEMELTSIEGITTVKLTFNSAPL
jgi:two-component system sensor histidine kinase/response regulator